MQQEARNTGGRSLWRFDIQLRHQAVQFVSAGNLEPAQEISTKPIDKDISTTGTALTTEERYDSATETTPDCRLYPNFPSANKTMPRPALPVRMRSCSSEDSSEDEIVFRGRRSRPESISRFSSHGVADADLEGELDGEPPAYTRQHVDTAVDAPLDSAVSISSRESSPSFIRIENNPAIRSHGITDEDEILADYIANIDDGSEDEDSSSSIDERPIEGDACTTTTPAAADQDALTPESESEDIASDYLEMSLAVGLGDAKSNRRNIEKCTFASATAFADALEQSPYYDFDVMDFSRPSLRKKTKKHEHFNLDALGTELQSELASAWNNDRLKKKSKKREREELRAQGLLGRRKNDPDLKTKYADGIGIEDLKSEIRLFLLSPKNSLSLPPMTKHRRMLIHDMAHALRLTSQSRGKGSSRFPVLSKTSRTLKYTQRTIPQIDRVLLRERFSPRALKAWDNTRGQGAKGKRNHGNVSYMDGDVVGASAPEIGAGNKGRAMLEKMGWSTGTALGATHNKGILLPVPHVVKNSKAGLG
ncbi:hypothetical protein BDW59DRAFT_81477 [Aspergillus cavernicola]|uniref:Protein SQS1 n=1 Tax=Aspergillus cavernicola TaxID=176166 RepID=A0ABR4IAH3_9EURO